MSMDIRNDIQMARNVLLNGENSLDFDKYFSQNNFGDETPVNLDLLHKNTEKTIIIKSEIQFVLDEINKLTQEQGKEIPFFLTGKKLEDGTIRYDQIFTGKANNERVAQYSSILPALNKFVNENKDEPNNIVCHGHTHPPLGDFYKNFSIADLGAYVNLANNKMFGNIDTMGMVLVDGNYNFIDYDKGEFNAIPNVVREIKKDIKYEKLPSYSSELTKPTEKYGDDLAGKDSDVQVNEHQVTNNQELVAYKKESIWAKLKNKITNLFEKISNKKQQGNIEDKPVYTAYINEFGEILRDNDDKNDFRADLVELVNCDAPIFTPPPSNEERDISIENPNER